MTLKLSHAEQSNQRTRHDAIKEAPVKLSAVVALAKDSQGIWEKVKGKKAPERSRQAGRKREE